MERPKYLTEEEWSVLSHESAWDRDCDWDNYADAKESEFAALKSSHAETVKKLEGDLARVSESAMTMHDMMDSAALERDKWKEDAERIKELALILCRLLDRDTYVSIEGRPKAEEWGMAWQNMFEASGLGGTVAHSAPKGEKP
jgi:hypothetical protein